MTFKVRIVRPRIKRDWMPFITDHAVLRYLERIDGVDIDAVRMTLATDALRMAVVLDAKSMCIDGGHLVIEKGKVVSVLTAGMRRSADARKWRKRPPVKVPKRAEMIAMEAAE